MIIKFLQMLLLVFASFTFSFQVVAQEKVVKLKLIDSLYGIGGYNEIKFNKNGIGELPFSNAAGKILFKLDDGKVFADINGDGKFDKTDGNAIAAKETFHVPLKINGKEMQYSLRFPFVRPNTLFLMSHSRLEGKYNGKKISLIDNNLNGNFGEIGVDKFQIGREFIPTPLSGLISIGGELINIKIRENGGTIIVTPYKGPTAKIKLQTIDGWIVDFILTHQKKTISATINSDTTTVLIPGKYTIDKAIVMSRNMKTRFYGRGGSIVLEEGINVIKTGPPFKLEFTAFRSKEDIEEIKIESALLVGAAGEKYNASSLGSGKSSLKSYIRSGRKEKELSTLEYG